MEKVNKVFKKLNLIWQDEQEQYNDNGQPYNISTEDGEKTAFVEDLNDLHEFLEGLSAENDIKIKVTPYSNRSPDFLVYEK